MTHESLKKFLKVVNIAVACLAVLAVAVVPCFASDVSQYPPRYVMTPSTHLESIRIDFYETSTNEDFTILVDAPSFFYGGQETHYYTEVLRSPYTFVVEGDVLRGATGAYSQLMAYFIKLTAYNGGTEIPCTITKLTLYYNGSIVHASDTGVNFARLYDGNFDATILIPNNAPYTSVTTFTQERFVYRQHLGEYYNYMFTESQIDEYTHITSGNGGYMPIGVRSNYGTKNQSVLYQESGTTLQELPVNCQWFRVLSAEQVVTFPQGVATSNSFYLTDQYTRLDAGYDGAMLEPTTNVDPVQDTFEIGSFLKESANAFFQFEIAEGFTFGHLFWLVLGVSVLASLAFFLAGK